MDITKIMSNGKTIEWTLAFIFGFLTPLICVFLILYACPSADDATFDLPIVGAKCPGDFMGQIGIVLFGLPFVITSVLIVIAEYIVVQVAAIHSPYTGLLVGFACLPGLLVNTFSSWLMIKTLFYMYQKIKTIKIEFV